MATKHFLCRRMEEVRARETSATLEDLMVIDIRIILNLHSEECSKS